MEYLSNLTEQQQLELDAKNMPLNGMPNEMHTKDKHKRKKRGEAANPGARSQERCPSHHRHRVCIVASAIFRDDHEASNTGGYLENRHVQNGAAERTCCV